MFEQYMTGIQVGEDCIQIAEGRKKKEHFILKKVQKIDFDRPIKNTKGYLLKEEELTGLLHKMKIKNAAFLIDGEDIIEREAPAPKTSSKSFDQYIQYEMEDLIPVELSEYVTSYAVWDQKLHIAAAPKKLIEGYINACNAAGCRCLFVDTYQNVAHKIIDLQTIVSSCSREDISDFIHAIKLLYRDV